MAVVKREDDFSGYKFANDGSSVTLSGFSDRGYGYRDSFSREQSSGKEDRLFRL